MPRPHAIAIAGCGPAGLSAALALHRLGHRIRQTDSAPLPFARDHLVSLASKPRFAQRLFAGIVARRVGLR